MIKKKEVVEFKIEDSEFGGKSYGYIDDVKITVKGGIPGQVVKVFIKKIKKNEAEGQILEILKASPLEDQDTCPHFGECGGCFQQTIPYHKQLELKENQVKKLFEQSNIKDYQWLPIEGSPEIFNYRNKMEFSFGDEKKGGPLTLGMHKRGKHYDIVTVDYCRIMDEDFRALLISILEYFQKKDLPYYNTRKHEGYLRHLVIRKATFTGEILVNLVTTTQRVVDLKDLVEKLLKLNLKGKIVGVLHTFNDTLADVVQKDKMDILFGRDYIIEKLLGLQFKISAFSFFQTNSLGAQKLYTIVRDFVGEAENQVVFDLYCGTGTIGQIIAPNAKKVIGIEIIQEAVKAANENAKLNNLNNCYFIAGDVKEEVKKLKYKPDIVIIDPPRGGIHPQALKDIISLNASKIVYVSCNPKTLVRDLVELENKGYKTRKVQCVDMFPHTAHVETCVLLSHKSADDFISVKMEYADDRKIQPDRVTYKLIQEYIEEKYGFKVHTANIAEVKRNLGLPMYDAPNAVEELKRPYKPAPEYKVEAIKDALRHFKVID